ncbi:MAG TPA: extracellular solute-binding protein [Streptosporangiaceae bacterium]|jgi:raffinose/stachyose/melibiose transport system substrate-binding protein
MAGALVGLVALAAAACGSSSGSSGGSGGQVTLKIISWVNPPANKAFNKIDAEFEKKYPSIKVQYQLAANTAGPYETLLQTTVDSHSADIVTTNTPFQPLPPNATRATESTEQFWATHDVFEPLNGQPWLNNFTPSALASETYNGKTYGVLTGEYQWVVFYNKTDFAKYHVSVPHTFSQFISVLQLFKSKGLVPLWLGLGGGASGYAQQFMTEPLMSELWQPKVAGKNLALALQNGSTTWTDPAFVTAMTEEAQVAKYLEPSYTGVSWEGMPGAFAANKSPMLLDGSWDMASVQSANPSIKVGSFAFPGSNDPAMNQPLVADDLTLEVLKAAPEKAAALKWMSFFASKPIYQQYVDITGISPSQAGGTYSSFSSQVLGPLFGKGVNTTTIFPTLPSTEGYNDTTANFPLLQLAVMAGSKTPAAAAQAYQGDWKKP